MIWKLGMTFADIERQVLIEALTHFKGNVKQTQLALKYYSLPTIWRKLNQLQIDIHQLRRDLGVPEKNTWLPTGQHATRSEDIKKC